jgi:hypothetical protein
MKISKIIALSLFFVILLSSVASACGPWFDAAYLVRCSEEAFLSTPEGNFIFELENITGKEFYIQKESEDVKENTVDADLNDLKKALEKTDLSLKDQKRAYCSYEDARSEVQRYIEENAVAKEWKWYGGTFRQHERDERDSLYRLFHLNLHLDKNIPKEFRLYIEGAAAYHKYHFSKAIEIWKKILLLPADKRQYKSTWASFMIAKDHLSMRRQKEAIKYFNLTRQLAEEGYKDSLDLSRETYGWQALAAYEIKDYTTAINFYLKASDINSLNKVCNRALTLDNNQLKDIVKDDIARQVLAAWIVSHWWDSFYWVADPEEKKTRAEAFQKALESADIKESVKEADRIAWIYYNMGDFEKTREWLKLSGEKTALSKWIDVKLLIRDGQINQAINELQGLINTFEKNDEWNLFYHCKKQDVIRLINTQLGVLRLSRQEYIMAFDVLLKGACWEDIAYVAEKVLTPRELEDILRQYENVDLSYDQHTGYSGCIEEASLYKSLEYLLARRYARMSDWNKAIKYMPGRFERYWYINEPPYGIKHEYINLKDLTKTLSSYIQNAEDKKLHPKTRAENYYEAGLLMREYGMEITGTELDPDWFVFNGAYSYDSSLENRFAILTEERKNIYYSPNYYQNTLDEIAQRRERIKNKRGFWEGTKDEEKRVLASLPEPARRYHYRYKAADLMWKAAQLLPDNDQLKALALYKGGSYLKARYPEEADKFYKALVNTCGETALGREADELKWFPKAINEY